MAVFEEEDEGPRKPRPFRPFKSHEEYLYAMKEDLAEWLQSLYNLSVTADDFMEHLETGVVLCRHANRIIAVAKRWGHSLGECKEVVHRPDVQPGTFHARDNVHNFIQWCRVVLKIKECLLFETDDLVMRKNEKNVVLCLLEVARRGYRYGMPAPILVQMEREIDAEIAAAQEGESRTTPPSSLSLRGSSDEGHEADDDSESEPLATPRIVQPPPQIVTNDLRSLHERVAELLNRCSCPAQFPMIRVGDGKYRIGETQLLIFVRILRNHVMVRVGGGWDTLEHYLDKHDPCRCKSGRRISVNRVSPSSSGSIQVHLNSHNRPFSSGTSSSSRSSSVPTSPPSRRRSFDLSRLSSPDDRTSSRGSSSEDWAPSSRRHRGKGGRPSSADSSSEISEAEICRGGPDFLRRQRRYSPRKVMKFGENACSEDAEDSSLEPPSVIITPRSPPRSRIPMSQSPSPRHRCRSDDILGRRLSASRSETSLFQSAVNRGSRTPGHQGNRRGVQGSRPRSSSTTRTASSSPARTPEWNPKRRTLSLQSSPVKPVPPLLEEILNDSEVLDSDEKILERMERLINAYRAREASPDSSLADDFSSPIRPALKNIRRNSLSKIPVLTWHARQ